MDNQKLYRGLSQIYLCAVPVLTAVLGFTVHHVSYRVYLPVWLLNVLVMLVASWVLGTRSIATGTTGKKYIALSGLLLIAPWLFYSVFGGMGSPPETYAEWVASAFEQQVRYSFLIVGGIVVVLGFAVLRESLKTTEGNILSLIGFVAVAVAMALFILNMGYWHSFVLEAAKTTEALSTNQLPEWVKPVKKLFLVISIIEVALTYLATAAFAAALKEAKWFTPVAAWIYTAIGILAFVLVSLYGLYPNEVTANGFPFYPFMIPAIPFTLPFYMGVNLLKRAGK